jgi:hypothetical protein
MKGGGGRDERGDKEDEEDVEETDERKEGINASLAGLGSSAPSRAARDMASAMSRSLSSSSLSRNTMLRSDLPDGAAAAMIAVSTTERSDMGTVHVTVST